MPTLKDIKIYTYIKVLLVLDTKISERKAEKILDQFNNEMFYEFALIASIDNKNGLKILTNTKLVNNSMRYERKVKSLDRPFYDKGINQNLRLYIDNEPPFAYVSNDGNYSGMVKKYAKTLCGMNNVTCEIFSIAREVSEKQLTIDLSLTYTVTQGGDPHFANVFEFSYPLEFRHFCILVAKGKILNSLRDLLPNISLIFKIGIPICFMLCGIYWYYVVKGTPHEKNLYDIYFSMYAMLIYSGIYKSPKLSAERILFLSFILISTFFISQYTSILTSLLVAPQYEKDINSLEELESKKMTVIFPGQYGITLYHNYLNTEYYDKYFISTKLLFNQTSRNEIFLEFTQNKSLSQMIDCQIAKNFIQSNANLKNGLTRFYIIKEQYLLHLNSFHAQIRCPFMKHVNLLNAKLKESGIWQKWQKDTDFDRDDHGKESQKAVDEDVEVLPAETILEFGKLLLVGYGLALLAFLSEVVYFKCKNWYTKIFSQ